MQKIMTKSTFIHAIDSHLPKKKLSNHDLEKILDTSDEWIIKRTGISNRHIISEKDSVRTMAIASCASLVKKAKEDQLSIGAVIVATATAQGAMPSIACQVCNHYQINNAFAFDVNAACSGFIYALNLAHDRLNGNSEEAVLVIGVDAMSQVVDWNDRTTAILFGDGAGAVLLTKSNKPGLKAIQCGSDGHGEEMLKTTLCNGQHQLKMHGKEVFKYAVDRLTKSTKTLINQYNIDTESIDWVVPHQANIRILQQVTKKLCIQENKLITTLNKHANTSAASIPLALESAINDSKIKRGDRILMQAFGAGFTWGAAVWDY